MRRLLGWAADFVIDFAVGLAFIFVGVGLAAWRKRGVSAEERQREAKEKLDRFLAGKPGVSK